MAENAHVHAIKNICLAIFFFSLEWESHRPTLFAFCLFFFFIKIINKTSELLEQANNQKVSCHYSHYLHVLLCLSIVIDSQLVKDK